MAETYDNQLPEVIPVITNTEKNQAKNLVENPIFTKWVKEFRRKYIVNGFLMPIYAQDGRFSRPRLRVSKFGDYILPWETYGEIFHKVPPGWVRNEKTWFWTYLTDGQEMIKSHISIPDILKIDGIPAELIWQEILTITKELKMFGEDGGGFILSSHWTNESYLASIKQSTGWDEGEDGYLESYPLPNIPNWITLFYTFESYQLSSQYIETRPAWFHLANYTFFNSLLQRLPVFYSSLTEEGKLETLRFLDNSLSDQARNYIGKALLDMPTYLKQQTNTGKLERETQEMVWWLWHNVGHKPKKRKLSYGEIADIAGASRSGIQTAIERFSHKLKNKMDRHLLGQLLRIGGEIGLGYNLVYKSLLIEGFVPVREGEIDGFDDLDNLI